MRCLNKNCDGHYQPICDTCEYTGWIRVKDRFPEHTNDVLIIDDRGRMAVSCYFLAKDIWVWEVRDNQIGIGQVTHWMPLPKPPK